MMAPAGVELEMLVSEPDALTTVLSQSTIVSWKVCTSNHIEKTTI